MRLNNFHIVLADDDADHAFLFKTIMLREHPKAHIKVFGDGKSLLNYLSAAIPDILFLDLNMPGMSGLECIDIIKQMYHLRKTKIIVYSGSSNLNDIQQCYAHHADLYMVKPFTRQHLQSAIKNIFNFNWINNRFRYYFINNRFVPYTASN